MNGSYLNKSGTVWGPPYTGGLGQTAPVAPPPVGGTGCVVCGDEVEVLMGVQVTLPGGGERGKGREARE